MMRSKRIPRRSSVSLQARLLRLETEVEAHTPLSEAQSHPIDSEELCWRLNRLAARLEGIPQEQVPAGWLRILAVLETARQRRDQQSKRT